jgi:outer membrane protein assembly factor BamA
LAAKKQKTYRLLLVVMLGFFFVTVARASVATDARIEDYEGRQITAVELIFEGSTGTPATQAEFAALLKVAPNTTYSAVNVRESLQALFDSGRVANARVEVIEEGAARTGPVKLRFVVQRQIQVGEVRVELGPVTGSPISTDELRGRINFAQSGNRLTKQLISRNADEMQTYLRDRGYYNATIEPVEQLGARGLRATVTYKVTPGEQAKVEAFDIQIAGFDASTVRNSLALQSGVPFTRDALGEDVKRVRDALINLGFLSPVLDDARVERDARPRLSPRSRYFLRASPATALAATSRSFHNS